MTALHAAKDVPFGMYLSRLTAFCDAPPEVRIGGQRAFEFGVEKLLVGCRSGESAHIALSEQVIALSAGDVVGGFGVDLHFEPLMPAAAAGLAVVSTFGAGRELGKCAEWEIPVAAETSDAFHGGGGIGFLTNCTGRCWNSFTLMF